MNSTKDDFYYLNKLKNDLQFIVRHMENVSRTVFSENEILLDSMLFRMIQISENSNKISDEFRNMHADIPWKAIYGLRNRIVHDYGNVDLKIVYDVLKTDIPELLRQIEIL